MNHEFNLLMPDGEFVRFIGKIPDESQWKWRGAEVDVSVDIVEVLECGNIYAPQGAD